MVGATFFWGSSATVARYLFAREHVPALWVVEMRLLIAVALLGAWLRLRDPSTLRIRRSELPYFLVLGLCGVAAIQGSYYYTISELGVGLAILLQYLAPAIIVAYEVARGKERLSLPTALSLVSAITGTALLVSGVPRGDWWTHPMGWLVGFSSAFFFAFYILYSKWGLSRHRAETVLFYSFLFAGIFWATVSPIGQLLGSRLPARVWWLFLSLALFSTLVPFSLFNAGLRRLSPSQAGILATLEPVVAIGTSAVFLREWLKPVQLVGAGLVLLACALASRAKTVAAGEGSPLQTGPPP